MRLRVCVSHVSTREPSTIVGADRGAKAAADAGSSCRGIATTSSSSALEGKDFVDAMRCDAMEWVLAGIIFFRAVLGPSISSVSCALDRVWSCLLYGLVISNLEQNKEIEKQVAEAGTQKEGG